jgi:hypothetical protein
MEMDLNDFLGSEVAANTAALESALTSHDFVELSATILTVHA